MNSRARRAHERTRCSARGERSGYQRSSSGHSCPGSGAFARAAPMPTSSPRRARCAMARHSVVRRARRRSGAGDAQRRSRQKSPLHPVCSTSSRVMTRAVRLPLAASSSRPMACSSRRSPATARCRRLTPFQAASLEVSSAASARIEAGAVRLDLVGEGVVVGEGDGAADVEGSRRSGHLPAAVRPRARCGDAQLAFLDGLFAREGTCCGGSVMCSAYG